ncbi:hypothetical protein [Sphingomonas sp. S6]|jgi:hypothetical protein|uniref:hypothetical protein n=1 Tax=Sphingomonas sp. S6 TaxID=3368600 RepID=UPI000FA8499D|nr:hypothetical protein [uncultured Sphingomonas sp.]RTL15436.1 MAG: hypothetical protein EKK50_13100 [Sphingomonadaceae bacterium]
MEKNDIPPENLTIIFEKGNFDYDKLRSFLRVCQRNPKHPMTSKLKNIAISNLSAKSKSEDSALQVADLVAHALYKCVDHQDKNHFISEPRYLRELGPHFFGNPESGKVSGAGLYLVHSASDLNLDKDVEEVISNMVATPPTS